MDLIGIRCGGGGKDRAKSAAELAGSRCFVMLRLPDNGAHMFGHFAMWDECRRHTATLQGDRRHLFEIIRYGRPCRPYLDIEHEDGPPPPCVTVGDVVERLQGLVARVFREDYHIELAAEDFRWMQSPYPQKLSLHLVIANGTGPQLAFRGNHQDDPQGARHLAQRLAELDPECAGKMVDQAVYTRDRCMRVCGATKYGATSILRPFGGAEEDHDPPLAPDETLITGLSEARGLQLIGVPQREPAAVRAGRRRLTRPAQVMDEAPDVALVRGRMLELLRERLHPTAFLERPGADEDPLNGVRFSYRDRTEPCYTGRVHDGCMNLKCFVDQAGDVHARCFSSHCNDDDPHHPHRLGALSVEPDVGLSNAVLVDVPFLGTIGGACLSADPSLEAALRAWLLPAGASPRALSLRSHMGTGKTVLLGALLSALPPDETVLVVTYRQSLAVEQAGKLKAHGFVSYLDVAYDAPLDDRAEFPRVICQLESLRRIVALNGDLSPFDVIIVDEVESVLRHVNSPTVAAPAYVLGLIMQLLRESRRVLTMDAFWGDATHEFLREAGVENRVVRNLRRPDPQRVFKFSNDNPGWRAAIADDLAEGHNVVVCSLSSEMIERLRAWLLAADAIEPGDLLVHSSKTGDEVKRQLADVNALWTRYRLVMFSPTIGAGIDFNVPHFHRMYFYVCPQSCTPLGGIQMTGRVRAMARNTIRVCAAPSVKLRELPRGHATTSREMIRFILWMDERLQERRFGPMPAVRTRIQRRPDQPDRDEFYSLPSTTALLLLQARGEAERVNAGFRFFHEFRALAEDGGHRAEIFADVSDDPAKAIEEEIAAQAERPALNPDLPSGKELVIGRLMRLPQIDARMDSPARRALRDRLARGEATEEDKWTEFLARYRNAWCIDRVDETFLSSNGVQPICPEAHQLIRALCPPLGLAPTEEMSVDHRKTLARAPLIRELVQALGFASPFDLAHRIPDLMALWEPHLKDTALFRDYRNSAKLFTSSVKRGAWDLRSLSKSVGMVLRTVGLKLEAVPTYTRQNGKKVTTYTYRMKPLDVARMQELVRLRLRGCPHRLDACANEHARALMQLDEFPKWGHLIDRDRPPVARYVLIV
jgi:hypothetical protein